MDGDRTTTRSAGRSTSGDSPTPAKPPSPAERQAELEERGLMWHRCTMELARVRQQLRAAGTQPAAIAHGAREGAGVLAAWSVTLEGDQPGPLARAARQLARSAELPAHTPVPLKSLPRASGLALFMLAAGKPDSTVGWLIVSREIALLAGELGRVHRARGELERAQEVETELGAELAEIEAALERELPGAGEVLDAEAQAAKRAREPLPPPVREGAGEVEDVKRLINPAARAEATGGGRTAYGSPTFGDPARERQGEPALAGRQCPLCHSASTSPLEPVTPDILQHGIGHTPI